MNYEKKYKEALETVQEILNSGIDAIRIKTLKLRLQSGFPELKESEDERVRKEIVDFIMSSNKYGTNERCEAWLAWLEKQGENKHTDKVEPKFKVGDWVILNGVVAKILVKQKYGFVGLDIDGKDFFCNYGHTDSMRLWTINNAKDGDVLVNSKGQPFIFSGKYDDIHFDNPIAYCGVTCENKFREGTGGHWTSKIGVAPATKEQRDTLFAEMHEAGYEWDADKKELKKIEPKTLNADEVIEWLGKHIIEWKGQDLIKTFTPNSPAGKSYIVEQFKQDFGL